MWPNVNRTIMLFGGCVISCVCVVDKEACEKKVLYFGFYLEIDEKITYQKLNVKTVLTKFGLAALLDLEISVYVGYCI